MHCLRLEASSDSITQAILEFLDKSRSAQSHTNTTSNAPAPSLAPATISFNSTSEIIIGALHQEGSDPTQLKWLNVPDEGALPGVAQAVVPALTGRYETITKLLEESTKEEVSVSSKVKNLWQKKSVGWVQLPPSEPYSLSIRIPSGHFWMC